MHENRKTQKKPLKVTSATNMAAAQTGAAGPTKVYQYKLVLLGDSAVGKSSLVLRFAKGTGVVGENIPCK